MQGFLLWSQWFHQILEKQLLKIIINRIILMCHNKAAGDSIYNSGAKPPQESVDVSQVPVVPGLKKLAAVNAISLKHVI